jgi:hypothetical protein
VRSRRRNLKKPGSGLGYCVRIACRTYLWHQTISRPLRVSVWLKPPCGQGYALHLAVCQRLNLQLASFDRGLCKDAAHHQVAHQQLVI